MKTECPECHGMSVGRSPTGDWCNTCGWASPGVVCDRCGRSYVKEVHLNFAAGDGGAFCRVRDMATVERVI